MRLGKIAFCALLVLSMHSAFAREANSLQGFGDSAISSVIAQRTFAGLLPSIADYSQTAHSVLKDGEYCPADSLTGASYCQPGANWVMWDTPFMQFDSTDGKGNYAGSDLYMSGFGTGIGRMINDTTVIGLAVGWDQRKAYQDEFVNQDNNDFLIKSRSRSDSFHSAVYGGTAIGCFFVDAYAGYSKTWFRSHSDGRDIEHGGTDVLKAKYDDTVYSAGLKASYVWILPNETRITPSLGLDYAHLRHDKFKIRRNGDYIGDIRKTTFNSLQMPISVSVNRTFQSDILSFKGKPSWWTPEVRAGYVPQIGKKQVGGAFVWEDGDVDRYKSAKYNSYGTIGAGLKIKLADKFIFAVDYDFRYGSEYKSHLITGTYGVSF